MRPSLSAAQLALLLAALSPVSLAQFESTCSEAVGSVCLRCPRPLTARSAQAAAALPFTVDGGGSVPLLDAHMGQLRDPSDPQQQPGIAQCEPYTSQCTLTEAACSILHYGATCTAPRFTGRGQSLSVLAAVSVAADGDGRFRSTLIAGPGTPALRLTQAVNQLGAIRSFDTASLPGSGTARGFSSVVVAGRWVYYIPGCYSGYASGVSALCRTLVRYDTLCSSGGWGEAACYESVDLSSVLSLSFRNKINFGTAVYDGRRYLYLISGVGDSIRTPVAAFVRFDTQLSLTAPQSWRLFSTAISRTPSCAGSFTSAVTDGRYLYFMPGPAWSVLLGGVASSTVESEGRILRYDTRAMTDEAVGDTSSFW